MWIGCFPIWSATAYLERPTYPLCCFLFTTFPFPLAYLAVSSKPAEHARMRIGYEPEGLVAYCERRHAPPHGPRWVRSVCG